MKDELSGEPAWYAVRCVFLSGWSPEPAAQAYEERITLWRAGSADEAIERAEVEAREYAAGIGDRPDTYLGLAQSYWMFDELGDGAEVFSLVGPASWHRPPTWTGISTPVANSRSP